MGKTRRDREEAAQRLIPRATTVLGLARRTARVPEGRFAWWQHAPATWDPILPRAEVTRTRRRRMLRQTSLGSTRRRYAGDKLRWGYFGPPSTIGLSSETKVGARAESAPPPEGPRLRRPMCGVWYAPPWDAQGKKAPRTPRKAPNTRGWPFGPLEGSFWPWGGECNRRLLLPGGKIPPGPQLVLGIFIQENSGGIFQRKVF